MSKLFSPLTIKDVTFSNRIVISPMCTYSAIDGFASDWHLVHLGSRAVGGAGLIIIEATAVSAEGRISAHDLGIYKEEHIEMLERITAFIHQQGAVAGIQLAHAGRKAGCARSWEGGKQLKKEEGGWTTIAPSEVAFNSDDEIPEALSIEGIKMIISNFRRAALRSYKAGFRVVEIHAAHGYLLHQFLSPLSNHRTDEYGGSFENRIRLLVQVVEAVKEVWPQNLPLFVRISATDWVEGGWNVDESVKLAHILKQLGVDLIDTSSGGMVPYAKIPLAPGYQVSFAERIKREVGIMTGAVGLITDAQQAEDILQQEQADLILIARESLRNPYFPLNAAKQLGDDIDWPIQYLRGKL
ncbi:NADPH dehydrogenase NamA [Williamwhitmania taraxaci]|uniref:2,4-dienoyl-CoA reductase n=1 Tax=Williamwhitmania taraxaci TaxID=1640674 RepID=A0A1G6NW00_9BACT|nr:NADPH dehydrogenase NamA [Williamwhitmania taraxaci]SDC72112.1 2,4-dienoyl-CoA reductase [Williamwhitmania taraxaci]